MVRLNQKSASTTGRSCPTGLAIAALAIALLGGCDAAEAESEVVAPRLSAIQRDVFSKSCALGSCHDAQGPQSDLDLSSADASHASLVGIAGVDAPAVRVEPGDSDASLLVQAMESAVGDTIRQMPIGAPLSPEKIDAVREWIDMGAENN